MSACCGEASSGSSEVLFVARLDAVVLRCTAATLVQVSAVSNPPMPLAGGLTELLGISRFGAVGFFGSNLVSSTDRQWLLVSMEIALRLPATLSAAQ